MPRPRSNKSSQKSSRTSFGKRSDAEKSFRKKGSSPRPDSGERRSFSKPSGYRKSSSSDSSKFSAPGRKRSDDAPTGREDRGNFKPRPFGGGSDFGKRPFRKNADSGPASFNAGGKRPFRKKFDSDESSSKPLFKKTGGFKSSFRDDRGSSTPYDAKSGDRGKRPFNKNRDDAPFDKESPRRNTRDSFDKPEERKSEQPDSNNPDRKSFRKEERKSFVQARLGVADFKKPARARKEDTVVSEGKEKESPKNDPRPKERLAGPPGDAVTRLNKYIANSGVGSRRDADKLITMGLISVNGVVITELGTKVKSGDVVRYEDRVLKAEKPVYILLNKPKGFITTTDDPQERNTVMGLVAGACKERIYPVGRLDRNTTGLLLLTNDGDLADKLTHPSYKAKKVYKVELDKPFTKNDFQRVLDGVRLEEGKAIVDELAIISDDNKTVGLEIHIGWNRVVRRIFESLGYVVVKLDRSVYAGLDKKDTPRGTWRFLKSEEIVMLKHFK